MRSNVPRRAWLPVAVAAIVAVAAPASARADAVLDWNQHAADALIVTGLQTPPVWTVHLAIVHGAVYDAVNSIDRGHEPYLGFVRGARRSDSRDAAAATAAYRVLVSLLPAQREALTPLYDASLAGIPAGGAKSRGVAVGRAAAAAMLAARARDGRYPESPYRFPAPATPEEPWPVGAWRPVLPAYVNDPFAWVKDVKPFLVDDPARFASSGPHALLSPEYAQELNEVKRLGGLFSLGRTADQTDMARFWAEGPAIWTRVARQVSTARGLDAAANARLFAMLYTTGADSLIACWRDKARWLSWRPITAIREAGRDGNPATSGEPNWLPLINNPPYPEHPSGLTCVSSAHASTLRDVTGADQVPFSATGTNSGTTRSYTSFSQALTEVIDARVYSGVHFRKADVDGARIGDQVAAYRAQRYFRPLDD